MPTYRGPGLQEARTTGAIARIYPQGNDPQQAQPAGVIDCSGTRNAAGAAPMVTAVTVGKALGAPHGNFSITIKDPDDKGRQRPSLLSQVLDDDWIDIAFNINGQVHHTCRGQIDTISEDSGTNGDGAPSRTYTITGRDHGRIFVVNPIWFNRFRTEEAANQDTIRALDGGGEPHKVVEGILTKFLTVLASKGRIPIAVPPSMQVGGESLLDVLVFDSADFDRNPIRTSLILQVESNGASMWQFAQDWSDPHFCELFCDLRPRVGRDFDPERAYGIDDTFLGIVFRTKPFPTVAKGSASRWFTMPIMDVPEQWVARRKVGRGGLERYNAFFVGAQTLHSVADLDMHGPLWDEDDISRHGLRKFEVESRYITAQNDLFTMTRQQREAARDWHCLNPFLLSGSVDLSTLVPQLRVGTRMRILRDREVAQENYYVEQVAHTWDVRSGGNTSVGVTRGWIGDDLSYLTALQAAAARYTTLVDTP